MGNWGDFGGGVKSTRHYKCSAVMKDAVFMYAGRTTQKARKTFGGRYSKFKDHFVEGK